MIIEIVLGLALVFLIWKTVKKPSEYPPGLWGLPFVGYLPIGGKDPFVMLSDLRKEHGDIFIWRIGTQIMLFISDFEMIKDVLNRTDFIDRPKFQIMGLYNRDGDGKENTGIISSNGPHWLSIRRFSLRLMRDLGMGKSRMVSAVQYEANCLVEELKKRGDKPSPLPFCIHGAVLNVVWQMIASKRYPMNDPQIEKFESMIRNFQLHVTQIGLIDFFPFLPTILPSFILRKLIRADQVDQVKKDFYNFFLEYVEEHRATIDIEDPRDYVDSYLIEMEKQKNNPENQMCEKDLIVCLMDLFAAGSETTSTALKWEALYLANYPEVQKKLQQNVDDVMPKGSLPTLEDRSKLAYVEAFIHEIHRHASFVHLGLMHSAPQDTRIGKYFIPKDTILNFMAGVCHYDKRFWKNPDEFNPDRFIDEDGKFKQQTEGFLPFGIGKRVCMGESLARMELLIFTTAFAQNLTFSPPPGKKMDLNAMTENPFFRMPQENADIIISSRK